MISTLRLKRNYFEHVQSSLHLACLSWQTCSRTFHVSSAMELACSCHKIISSGYNILTSIENSIFFQYRVYINIKIFFDILNYRGGGMEDRPTTTGLSYHKGFSSPLDWIFSASPNNRRNEPQCSSVSGLFLKLPRRLQEVNPTRPRFHRGSECQILWSINYTQHPLSYDDPKETETDVDELNL